MFSLRPPRRPVCAGLSAGALHHERRRLLPLRRSLPMLLVLCLGTCAGPTYQMRPQASTPYDVTVDDLNARLCIEVGKLYSVAERRCVPAGTQPAAPGPVQP